MKLTKVLSASVWFAIIAASDQDNPGSANDGNGYRQGEIKDGMVPQKGQVESLFDIGITGEASHYTAENFELCDDKSEETCYYYDDGGSLTYYCASLVDGGCICPDGQKKCDAFSLTGGAASFCAITCCDSQTEEACYDYDDDGNFKTQYCAPLADGGCPCPEGLEKCDGDPLNGIASYCATICCDSTEEMCLDYDEDGKVNQYCAAFAEGGCPCPQGQEKCGADPLNGVTGYCATVCCDNEKEQMCLDYDEDGYMIQYCAPFAEGGCSCPEGEMKCYDTLNVGNSYCALVCCDGAKEETCTDYDDDGNIKQFCAALSDGGCPCPLGQKKCNADPWTDATSYCAMVCCTSSEETCSYYDKDGYVNQYCALIADGGCRDIDPDDNSNTTLYGEPISISEYDEEEVADILHAM